MDHRTKPAQGAGGGAEGAQPAVLINAFEVEKGVEEEFLAQWHKCGDHLKQQEGYISHRLHESLDPGARFRFVNVATWQSARHFQMAVEVPGFQQLAEALPGKSNPGLYRVIAEGRASS